MCKLFLHKDLSLYIILYIGTYFLGRSEEYSRDRYSTDCFVHSNTNIYKHFLKKKAVYTLIYHQPGNFSSSAGLKSVVADAATTPFGRSLSKRFRESRTSECPRAATKLFRVVAYKTLSLDLFFRASTYTSDTSFPRPRRLLLSSCNNISE